MTRAFETQEESVKPLKRCLCAKSAFLLFYFETFITLLVLGNKMAFIYTPNVLVSL
jgi:hypothetical protein